MRVNAILTQSEGKRNDRSVRCAEKRARRARMAKLCGPVERSGKRSRGRKGKSLDLVTESCDLDIKRQATWGMSVHIALRHQPPAE